MINGFGSGILTQRMSDYAKDILVSADWVENRLEAFQRDDPEYRLVEVDLDTSAYSDGHIPGAIGFDWKADLQDPVSFDVPTRGELEALLGGAGISTNSTIILYGDMMNWFAAYAYWLLTYYGHDDIRILNGGRDYWRMNDYPLTDERPSFTAQSYTTQGPNESIRADRSEVEAAMRRNASIVDVRSPEEYRGEILAPPGWNEGVQRGGHIPGAVNIPWSRAVNDEGTFKSVDELREVYDDITTKSDEIIVYCRIGERSAVAWVVLHELLGYTNVQHYYGSFVEWGNTVGALIEQGQ